MPLLPLKRPDLQAEPIIRPEILLDRARKLILSGQLDQARTICEQVLLSDPMSAASLHMIGVILAEEGRPDEAVAHFENAIRIAPDYVDAWRNQGVALSDLGLLDEALVCFDQVVTMQPGMVDGHALRAMTLYRLGRFEEAVRAHEPIGERTSQDAAMIANRAAAMLWTGRTEEAMAEFDRAVELDPEYAPAWMNKALAHLLLGDLPNGFRMYEWRWKRPEQSRAVREFKRPLWVGQSSLAGKTILLHREQGFGDTIQFCRYASLAAQEGAHVILEVQPALVSLLRSLTGGISVIAPGNPHPDFDFHSPLMSLPLGFRTSLDTIPDGGPYLQADPVLVAKWRETLPATRGKRIGLVWAGSSFTGHADQASYDRRRSVSLRKMSPLASVSGCDFVSLQVGPAVAQAATPPAGMRLHSYSELLRDFNDTAALIETLDLVIGVDTSVIHLAGALGKPVWLLNRFDTDWRWLLDRDDSPWYPTLRQFRQRSPGNWDDVILRVAEALREFVAQTIERAIPVDEEF